MGGPGQGDSGTGQWLKPEHQAGAVLDMAGLSPLSPPLRHPETSPAVSPQRLLWASSQNGCLMASVCLHGTKRFHEWFIPVSEVGTALPVRAYVRGHTVLFFTWVEGEGN